MSKIQIGPAEAEEMRQALKEAYESDEVVKISELPPEKRKMWLKIQAIIREAVEERERGIN
jgi:hypothetical protein